MEESPQEILIGDAAVFNGAWQQMEIVRDGEVVAIAKIERSDIPNLVEELESMGEFLDEMDGRDE